MKILKGVSLRSGIVKGAVSLYISEIENTLPHYSIDPKQIPNELSRFYETIDNTRKGMERIVEVSEKRFGEEAKEIFKAHISILNDKELLEDIADVIKTKKFNAEHAINDIFEKHIKEYQEKNTHFRELAHDFMDIRARILQTFKVETGRYKSSLNERKPVIIAAKYITPSMVINIPRKNVLAFVTEEGGVTDHAMILARSHGIPILSGIDVEKELDCGMHIIVDASAGKIIISPERKTQKYYNRKIANIEKKKDFCAVRKNLPVYIKDKEKITLKLNISIPSEIHYLKELPHDGMGLLRTEFLFMQRDRVPTETEQYETYRKFLDEVPNRPVVVRLLDIREDKLPPYFNFYRRMRHGLCLRGAIAAETFPEIYIKQVRALLRANVNSNLRLLYPMISDLGDVKTFRNIIKKAKKMLRQERVDFNDVNIQEGVMIETPAAAVMAEKILKEVDFANIGSNDLSIYTLAVSRGSLSAEKRYHILHPALVRLLELVVIAGKKAKKEVCLCGEIASFEEFYSLFLSIGLKSFSIAASKFEDIKCHLLHEKGIDKSLIQKFFNMKTKKEIDEFFEK
jgi:phosphoenolpyruvate-protein phosphotransferase (PTS system enzyme I)